MARFFVTAQRITDFSDTVEANSLEEAEAIVREWIADDFTEDGNCWTTDIIEDWTEQE